MSCCVYRINLSADGVTGIRHAERRWLLKDLFIGRRLAGTVELFQQEVVGLCDDKRKLFGSEDVPEPGEDGLLRPGRCRSYVSCLYY